MTHGDRSDGLTHRTCPYLIVAVILTVICLCIQIGAFNLGGVDMARVYNLWFTDPIGKHHFDV